MFVGLLVSRTFIDTDIPSKGIKVKIISPSVARAFDSWPEAIDVHVNATGRYFLNSREVSLEQLLSALESTFKTRANWTVYVSGDPEASYGDVIQAMDAIRTAHGTVVLLSGRRRTDLSR